jgi:hypothetical protein
MKRDHLGKSSRIFLSIYVEINFLTTKHMKNAKMISINNSGSGGPNPESRATSSTGAYVGQMGTK